MDLLGWIIVTIAVPSIAPVVFQLLLVHNLPSAITASLSPDQRWWASPVKDGQLHWVTVALSTTALHDLSPRVAAAGWLQGLLIAMVTIGAFLAALGALFPVQIGDQRWRYRALVPSLLGLIVSGWIFAKIHSS